MKLVLEYSIPDDAYSAWCAYNAQHLHNAITEIEQHLRDVRKHGADPKKALTRIDDVLIELTAVAGQPLNG